MSRTFHSHWIIADGNEAGTGDSAALFPYWSLTKTALAVCALRVEAQGVLALWEVQEPAPYTLEQMLAHTAGLPDYGALPAYHEAVAARGPAWSRGRMLEQAMALGMRFAPGEGWSYSNIGYMFVKERLEAATGQTIGEVFAENLFRPLGLSSVFLAQDLMDFDKIHWPQEAGYDPNWVYHGCLVGTAADAARLVHGLFSGGLVSEATLAKMCALYDLGGPLPGRPWSRCGYGLGLMAGRLQDAGRVIGHSGAGPFCVNAVYHFPDLPEPLTVASFTDGAEEGVAEFEAVRIAMEQQKNAAQ